MGRRFKMTSIFVVNGSKEMVQVLRARGVPVGMFQSIKGIVLPFDPGTSYFDDGVAARATTDGEIAILAKWAIEAQMTLELDFSNRRRVSLSEAQVRDLADQFTFFIGKE